MAFLKSQRSNSILDKFLTHSTIIIILIFAVFPFYWIIASTLKVSKLLYTRVPIFFPWPISFENFLIVLKDEKFMIPFRNSLFLGISTSLLAIIIASFAAYSLARYKYKGKRVIMFLMIFTYLLPQALMIVPIYVIFNKFHLTNTFMGIILSYLTISLPFSILLLRNFFISFPEELEEAALIDGCNRMGAFWRIVMPLISPGIIAVTLFTFIVVWNDLLYVMILAEDSYHITAAVHINKLFTTQFARQNYGLILAQGSVVTIPIVIMFVFLQKYVVQGMSAGAIKGWFLVRDSFYPYENLYEITPIVIY